jgi:hypothetical protein
MSIHGSRFLIIEGIIYLRNRSAVGYPPVDTNFRKAEIRAHSKENGVYIQVDGIEKGTPSR